MKKLMMVMVIGLAISSLGFARERDGGRGDRGRGFEFSRGRDHGDRGFERRDGRRFDHDRFRRDDDWGGFHGQGYAYAYPDTYYDPSYVDPYAYSAPVYDPGPAVVIGREDRGFRDRDWDRDHHRGWDRDHWHGRHDDRRR